MRVAVSFRPCSVILGALTLITFTPVLSAAPSVKDDKQFAPHEVIVPSPAPARRMEGHSEPVNCVAFSSDAAQIVSGSDDRTVRLWDVKAGRLLHTFEGHTAPVRSVGFSRDGKFLVSGSDDRSARVWDVKTGDLVALLDGHRGPVFDVCFHPDGKRIFSVCVDGYLRIWDVKTERLAAKFAHGERVLAIALNQAGTKVVTATDRSAFLWNLKDPKPIAKWDVVSLDEDHVMGIDLLPDASRLITCTAKDGFRNWNVADQKELDHEKEEYRHNFFGLSSVRRVPGHKIAIVTGVLSAYGYEMPSGSPMFDLKVVPDAIPTTVAVSADGKWAVTAGKAYSTNRPPGPSFSLYLWDLAAVVKEAEKAR